MATKTAPFAPAVPGPTALPAGLTKPMAARKRDVAKPQARLKVPPARAKLAPLGKVGKKPVDPRPMLVRDSFTMPEADFALFATLKSKALLARRAAKKSELLRAGLQLLAALDAESLVAALDSLEPVKTGRPKKGQA